jgi:hypothetical protein
MIHKVRRKSWEHKKKRKRGVPEIIDPVFAKTSQNARFLLSENERFGLVFVKTGSKNSGRELEKNLQGNLASTLQMKGQPVRIECKCLVLIYVSPEIKNYKTELLTLTLLKGVTWL